MPLSSRSKALALIVAAGAAWLVAPIQAQTSELLMFERGGCVWCARWDRDVAPIYEKTDEAKLLPLRRVNIDRGTPDGITLAAPVRYTPTFVVIDDGREIGRITGYINDESFWGLLGTYVGKLAKPNAARNPPS